jgi:hypothetical protein
MVTNTHVPQNIGILFTDLSTTSFPKRILLHGDSVVMSVCPQIIVPKLQTPFDGAGYVRHIHKGITFFHLFCHILRDNFSKALSELLCTSS